MNQKLTLWVGPFIDLLVLNLSFAWTTEPKTLLIHIKTGLKHDDAGADSTAADCRFLSRLFNTDC
jgi:hypothetical protein